MYMQGMPTFCMVLHTHTAHRFAALRATMRRFVPPPVSTHRTAGPAWR